MGHYDLLDKQTRSKDPARDLGALQGLPACPEVPYTAAQKQSSATDPRKSQMAFLTSDFVFRGTGRLASAAQRPSKAFRTKKRVGTAAGMDEDWKR